MKHLPILLKIIQLQKISRSDIQGYFRDIPQRTLDRAIADMIQSGLISRSIQGKEVIYIPTEKAIQSYYFSVNFFERPKKEFSWDFLRGYSPNETSFLGSSHLAQLQQAFQRLPMQTIDYINNQRGIENMLIDMSFASSKLEGNTYTYLDTEKLIKMGRESSTHTQFEAQMILNHKYALQYIIESRSTGLSTKKDFYDVHSLLARDLIRSDRLGVIRSEPVRIGRSAYTPLDNPMQLMEVFEIFLEKLNAIRHPCEQAMFILVFIPYFQLFYDVNKRTSRIAANLPLIRAGLPPLTLLGISDDAYVDAILHIYERQDVMPLANQVVENYLQNMDRYIA